MTPWYRLPRRNGKNMGKTDIATLDEEDILEAVKQLGGTIDDQGFIRNAEGKNVVCTACGELLTENNLGNIFPWGTLACTKLQCFLTASNNVDVKVRKRLF